MGTARCGRGRERHRAIERVVDTFGTELSPLIDPGLADLRIEQAEPLIEPVDATVYRLHSSYLPLATRQRIIELLREPGS